MIKFFRKIRYNLMEQNKTGKYLKYAIGEILLVMIGILLALQVNNWNEDRKNSVLEQEILKQLEEEYDFNLVQLDQKIAMRNRIIKASLDVLKYIDNLETDVNRDTLISKIRHLNIDPTFDPIQNDLISSGYIRLIKNKELKKYLSNWSSDVQAVREMELQWQRFKTDLNTPYQINLGIVRDMEHVNYLRELTPIFIIGKTEGNRLVLGKSSKTPSTESILKDRDLESIMTVAIRTNNTANLQSVVLRERIVEILNLINKEIENK